MGRFSATECTYPPTYVVILIEYPYQAGGSVYVPFPFHEPFNEYGEGELFCFEGGVRMVQSGGAGIDNYATGHVRETLPCAAVVPCFAGNRISATPVTLVGGRRCGVYIVGIAEDTCERMLVTHERTGEGGRGDQRHVSLLPHWCCQWQGD